MKNPNVVEIHYSTPGGWQSRRRTVELTNCLDVAAELHAQGNRIRSLWERRPHKNNCGRVVASWDNPYMYCETLEDLCNQITRERNAEYVDG